MVYECRRAVKIPIIGMGGIATATRRARVHHRRRHRRAGRHGELRRPVHLDQAARRHSRLPAAPRHRARRAISSAPSTPRRARSSGSAPSRARRRHGRSARCELATALDGVAGGVQVGSRLFTLEGPALVRELVDARRARLPRPEVPRHSRTRWRRRSRPPSQTGAWMINVHASGGVPMMQAAAQARPRDGAAARTAAAAAHRASPCSRAWTRPALRDIGVRRGRCSTRSWRWRGWRRAAGLRRRRRVAAGDSRIRAPAATTS